MRRLAFGQLGTIRVETLSPQDDTSSASFEELAMPLLDSLYHFARWLVHYQNDAEDLIQETYLKALRHFSSFQPGTNFRAWMYRILRNTFLTSCTGLRAASTISLDSEEEEGPELAIENETPETILMNHLNYQLVQSAIDHLPVHYRETLVHLRRGRDVVPGDRRNTFLANRNGYVTSSQSPEDSPRVAP